MKGGAVKAANIFVILLSLFMIVLFLLTLNFWINVEDVCKKQCHDDYKRKLILFMIVLSMLFTFINNFFLKLDQINYLIIVGVISTLNNILQFLYLRQLKNECLCSKSIVMDMIRIFNYFSLFILVPINIIMILYLKYSETM